jgi:hypothetical protein
VLISTHHVWQAGLEGSIGLSLLLSALLFEKNTTWVVSKLSELERNEKTILFLEEDLGQQKELTAKESVSSVEKLEALRLQFEELQSEGSAFQVLNDVLRKTAAKAIEEKEAALVQNLYFDRKEGLLLEEIGSLQKENHRLGNESALAQQNKQLFHELNETRVREAKTHLINETLVRLHAKENQRAREYETKLIEKEMGSQQSLQIELLYQQLKAQFEEKNQILHQTRAKLFQSDTELQTLQKKLQEKEFETQPLFNEMNEEVGLLAEEMFALQCENQELQTLISYLMQQSVVIKKSSEKIITAPEQVTLF